LEGKQGEPRLYHAKAREIEGRPLPGKVAPLERGQSGEQSFGQIRTGELRKSARKLQTGDLKTSQAMM
jgi:hypothetical protein